VSKKKRVVFEECQFVGEGEEDIRDILKRQFVRYINQEKGYPYMSIKKEEKVGKKRR
jgi:hypothetical protein